VARELFHHVKAIIPWPSVRDVALGSAADGVAAAATVEAVTIAPGEGIVSGAAANDIVSGQAGEPVVEPIPKQDIVELASDDALHAEQSVVSLPSRLVDGQVDSHRPFRRISKGPVIANDVRPPAAIDAIVARSREDVLSTWASENTIVSASAVQVSAEPPRRLILLDEKIVAVVSDQRVGAHPTVELVVSVSAEQRVLALISADEVVTAAAVNGVRAVAACDDIGPRGSDDVVVAGCPGNRNWLSETRGGRRRSRYLDTGAAEECKGAHRSQQGRTGSFSHTGIPRL
jgi:hypothetical protein